MTEAFAKVVGHDGKAVVRVTQTIDRMVSKSDLEQEKASLLQEIDNMQERVRKIDDMLAMLK